MATRMKTKAAYREENRDRRPYAVARYIRISPKKVSIVLDLIRGKSVAEADAILEYTPKSSAPVVRKLLASATANAENNQMMNRDGLYVAETFVGPGPTLSATVRAPAAVRHPSASARATSPSSWTRKSKAGGYYGPES